MNWSWDDELPPGLFAAPAATAEGGMKEFPFRVVDLTHPLQPGMPVWPGDPPLEIAPAAAMEREGYFLERFSLGGHSGTHAGAPAHYLAGGLTISAIPASRLVAPLFTITVPLQCDALLEPADVADWEARFGPLPPGSAVAVATGWSRRWPDEKSYLGRAADGSLHFPGISPAAMELIVRARGARIVGIDTPGLDGGLSADFLSGKILAGQGGIHLENLTALDQLPARGAWIVIGALPIAGGSGSPARVLALVTRA
jgi:kynurenine formamidase